MKYIKLGIFKARNTMPSGNIQTRQLAFAVIRGAHKRLLMKALPGRVAIYFHALEPSDSLQLKACIEYFLNLGYRVVPVTEFVDERATGRMLFLSFDDNYKNWHGSLDLLDYLGVRGMFYVNTLPFMDTCPERERVAYFKRIDYARSTLSMTRSELLELAQAGHGIGCHSHSHFNLAQIDPGRWDGEIRDSKRQLEDLVGQPVEHFAYPYGMRRYFTASLRDYCQSIGFKTIASAIPGRQQARRIDPFNVHRTRWNLARSLADNIEDIRIDGRLFERLTGRSAVG
jgi:peptidoglycan/xylan/chitin deacetylase (PgdA/CDA1 family)